MYVPFGSSCPQNTPTMFSSSSRLDYVNDTDMRIARFNLLKRSSKQTDTYAEKCIKDGKLK